MYTPEQFAQVSERMVRHQKKMLTLVNNGSPETSAEYVNVAADAKAASMELSSMQRDNRTEELSRSETPGGGSRIAVDRRVSFANSEAIAHYIRTRDESGLDRDEDGLEAISGRDLMTLVVSSDPAGGYTVVPRPLQGAHDSLAQSAFRRAGATQRITDSDTYVEIRVSGDTGEWLAEVPSGSQSSNPDISVFRAPIKKRGDLHLISEQHVADSEIDLGAMVIENSVDSMMVAEDAGLMSGTGIGNEPLGMLNSPELVTPIDVSGTTANEISSTAADAGSGPKIVAFIGQLPSRFHQGAAFQMHGETWAEVRSLIRADGSPYFPETFTGFTLAGYPVYLNDSVPTGGVDANNVIVFGNFAKGFRVANKPEGIRVRILQERYAEIDCIGLRIRYRIGGGMYLPQAFRVGRV